MRHFFQWLADLSSDRSRLVRRRAQRALIALEGLEGRRLLSRGHGLVLAHAAVVQSLDHESSKNHGADAANHDADDTQGVDAANHDANDTPGADPTNHDANDTTSTDPANHDSTDTKSSDPTNSGSTDTKSTDSPSSTDSTKQGVDVNSSVSPKVRSSRVGKGQGTGTAHVTSNVLHANHVIGHHRGR